MSRRLTVFMAIGLGATLPGAAPALAAGERGIALVVQLGAGSGSILDLCVKEPPGTTGAQALSDGLRRAGLAEPAYATSGLLCSIAGQPSVGCGVRTAAGYQYWAYFHGGPSGWTYATDGPGTHQVTPAVVEGWRFEEAGTGHPGDPGPVVPADPAAICDAAQPSPPTTLDMPSTSVPPVERHDVGAQPTTSGAPVTTTEAPRPPTTLRRVVSATQRLHATRPTSPVPARSSPAGTIGGMAIVVLVLGAGIVIWRRRAT